jgi:hypothetical protein
VSYHAAPDGKSRSLEARVVDVAINIFAKPYQTALSVLSLLRFCDRHIGKFYLQFEPSGSRYDHVPPYAVAAYLGDRAVVYQPEIWIECDAVRPERLDDPAYRLALRYESAFEHTRERYLFIMHNDVLIKRDVIGAMLERMDGHIAVGSIGQCWNCPAARADVVRAAGLGERACAPDRYLEFRPDYAGLNRLYAVAREQGMRVRPYWEGWEAKYRDAAWPLPECRVNEWGCLVDVETARPHVRPQGPILPFGAYEDCGSVSLDIDVAWFRDLHRLGFTARHLNLDPCLRHWVGSHRMTRGLHMQAETTARNLLEKNFSGFVAWCRTEKNGLFAEAGAG